MNQNHSAKKIIIEDFNARIGVEQGAEIIGEETERKSRDKEENMKEKF